MSNQISLEGYSNHPLFRTLEDLRNSSSMGSQSGMDHFTGKAVCISDYFLSMPIGNIKIDFSNLPVHLLGIYQLKGAGDCAEQMVLFDNPIPEVPLMWFYRKIDRKGISLTDCSVSVDNQQIVYFGAQDMIVPSGLPVDLRQLSLAILCEAYNYFSSERRGLERRGLNTTLPSYFMSDCTGVEEYVRSCMIAISLIEGRKDFESRIGTRERFVKRLIEHERLDPASLYYVMGKGIRHEISNEKNFAVLERRIKRVLAKRAADETVSSDKPIPFGVAMHYVKQLCHR